MNPNYVSRWSNDPTDYNEYLNRPDQQNQNQNKTNGNNAPPHRQQEREPKQNNANKNKYIFNRDQPTASTAPFGGLRKIPGAPQYQGGGNSVLGPMHDELEQGQHDDDHNNQDYANMGHNNDFNKFTDKYMPSRNTNNNQPPTAGRHRSTSSSYYPSSLSKNEDPSEIIRDDDSQPPAYPPPPEHQSQTRGIYNNAYNNNNTPYNNTYSNNNRSPPKTNNNNKSQFNFEDPSQANNSSSSRPPYSNFMEKLDPKSSSPLEKSEASLHYRPNQSSNLNHQSIAESLPSPPNFPAYKPMANLNNRASSSASSPQNNTDNNNNFYNLGGNNIMSSFAKTQEPIGIHPDDDVDLSLPPTHSSSKLDKFRSNSGNKLLKNTNSMNNNNNNNNKIPFSGPTGEYHDDDDDDDEMMNIDGRNTRNLASLKEEEQLDELDMLLYTISKHDASSAKNKDNINNNNKKSTTTAADNNNNAKDETGSTLPPPPLSEADATLFYKLMQRKVLWVRRAQFSLFDWASKLQSYEQALNEREARLADTETQRANAYQERVLALTETEAILRKGIDRQKRGQKQIAVEKDKLKRMTDEIERAASSTRTTNDFSFTDRLRVAQEHLGGKQQKAPIVNSSTTSTNRYLDSTATENNNNRPRRSSSAAMSFPSRSNSDYNNNLSDKDNDDNNYAAVIDINSPTSQASGNSPPRPRESVNLKSALRAPSYTNLGSDANSANVADGAGGGGDGRKKTAFVVPS